jgi:hypothetical protein
MDLIRGRTPPDDPIRVTVLNFQCHSLPRDATLDYFSQLSRILQLHSEHAIEHR